MGAGNGDHSLQKFVFEAGREEAFPGGEQDPGRDI